MAVAAPGRDTSRWTSPYAYLRLALAVVWVLRLTVTVLFGERPASFSDFNSAVAAGRVQSVRLVGALPAGSTGSVLVELHWRDGLVARVTQVREVSSNSEAYPSGISMTVLGWQVPGLIGLAALVTWLLTLGLLINGPEPWRATRWAWFWIIANPLAGIGSLAFLLLSGPTPMLPAAKSNGRRLHGGWAFLLVTVAHAIRL